jgi:uncharacterized protein YndB with AHSA1/START domain
MIKKILIVLVIILVVFVVIVAMQPAAYRITRTATMSAPPADVFAQVNDLHKFQDWSPWAKLDPGLKQTYDGAPAGTGAIYSWEGNKKVGAGRMTITDSRTNDLVSMKLEFLKPFASTATTEFAFKPEGNQTSVTWSMFGENNFMAKAFCLFMNMDKMVGGDFERGLAQLKSLVESGNKSK